MPEIEELYGYKIQKATTEYLGRNWIAWFTNEIQIQDGPYKFSGLPGLILKISDEKNDHVFNFIGSKINNGRLISIDDEEKEVIVSSMKFNQLWKEYLKDPAKKIKQLFSNNDGTTIKVTDANGRELSQSEIIRNKEQRVKDNLKKTNNFLELTLYK